MTRFARAKGSKSSNEKKPEEATSWCELKNAMLLKNSKKTEIVIPEQKDKNVKVDSVQENLKWASLGENEFDKSISLIKNHLSKKRKLNDTSSSDDKGNKNKIGKKLKTKESVKIEKEEIFESESGSNKKKKLQKKCKAGKKRNADEISSDVSMKKLKKENDENLTSSEHLGERKGGGKSENKRNMKFKNVKLKKGKNKSDEHEHEDKRRGKFDKFNKKFDRKKGKSKDSLVDEIIVNGEKIPIVKFQGFNVTLEDAERLKKLRSDLVKEGIQKNKLEAVIKLERRRAEKALSRLKKAVCFLCRGHGHLLSNCPNLKEKEDTSTGICYKCGSTEHTAMECKVVRETSFQFAECFICKEQGHIARQCPDNPRGLYPNGGACRECGDVTHLRKDCPKVLSQKAENEVTIGVRDDRDLECLDEEIVSKQRKKKVVKKNSTIKF